MASKYIQTTDITDQVINDFGVTVVQAKLDLSDKAVEDLAERRDLEVSEIELSPVHWQLIRWATYWVGREICLDHLGKNNVDVADIEKYKIKYDLYNELLAETEKLITAAMIAGVVDGRRDRATVMTGVLFRT